MNVRRRIAVAATAVAAVPLVSACGFDVQTNQLYTPAEGPNNLSGSVDVLNAVVVSASDGSGTLAATLVDSQGGPPDELLGVTGLGDDRDVRATLSGETAVPRGGLLNLATEGGVTLEGADVVPGAVVRLRFSFAQAQAVTLNAVVEDQTAEGPYAEVPTD